MRHPSRVTSRALLCTLPLLASLACSESSVEVGGTLSIQLTVTPATQTQGQPVQWQTSAAGRSLAGTVVDFGDGQVDSVAAMGAQTQALNNEKTYDSVGVFIVVAEVVDQLQGSAMDSATVEIVAPGT